MSALHALTLDQIRLFVAVVDEGSFSAAGRRLRRAQSAVSYGIANLEELLEVRLFDRTGRRPRLTAAGAALLDDAREVLERVGALHAHATRLTGDVEPEVWVAVDAIVPQAWVVALCEHFHQRFPDVALHLYTDVVSGVAARVLDGSCHLGLGGPPGTDSDRLERRLLAHLELLPVAAPHHPLGAAAGPLPLRALKEHVQIVISVRGPDDDRPDHGVVSSRTWRVADAATKQALIEAGLGWGHLPAERVRPSLDAGALVTLSLEEPALDPRRIPLYAVTRRDEPPGPAALALLDFLARRGQGC